jgi:nucleoside-diphosphate-sugar epimerase
MKQNQRHILVIGGAGYIGSSLSRKLLNKDYKVRVLDKLIYNNAPSVFDMIEEKNFSFIYGDYGDETVLNNSLEGITDIVLLAALVGDPICKKYPGLARKVNLEYAKNLYERLKSKSIDRFIFTSTCSNYGLRNDTPADEESKLNPLSLYAETKVEFEKYILDNLKNIDYSPTILRLATAFGISKRMRFDLTISEFSRELALGKELVVFDENTWRPYCHISDISNAIITVLEAPKDKVRGQVFNVGSNNENYTKKMIVEIIQKYVDNALINYKQGGFDPRNYRVSFDKIKSILNYKTQNTAEESIRNLINAVNNNLYTDVETRKYFYGNYFIQE